MSDKPIRRLICCICGGETRGRQWWNRDTGYGVCVECAEAQLHTADPEEHKHLYGKRGVHWAVQP